MINQHYIIMVRCNFTIIRVQCVSETVSVKTKVVKTFTVGSFFATSFGEFTENLFFFLIFSKIFLRDFVMKTKATGANSSVRNLHNRKNRQSNEWCLKIDYLQLTRHFIHLFHDISKKHIHKSWAMQHFVTLEGKKTWKLKLSKRLCKQNNAERFLWQILRSAEKKACKMKTARKTQKTQRANA